MMLRILLTLGLVVSAVRANAAVFQSFGCDKLDFFGRPNVRWHFLAAKEPGLVLAFQRTGERVTRDRGDWITKYPDAWVVRPSHCNVYVPKERGQFASGPVKLLVDFEWRDPNGKLFLEGYRVDMTMKLTTPGDPKTIQLRTVEGFGFCRTQDTCLKMWVVDSE